jgi:phage-related protein
MPMWITQKVMEGVQRIFKQYGGKWMKALGDGLKKAWDSVANWFKGIGNAILRFWNGAKAWLLEAGHNIIDGLKNGILRAWRAVVSWFGRIPEWIGNLWSGAIGWLKSAGSAVIEGFQQGLSSAWDAMVGWLQDRINSLPGFVKDFLGITSPSKVFREIGKNTMKGMWMGMLDESAHVDKAMRDMMDKVHGEGSMGVRRGGLSVAGARGRVQGTLRIVGTQDLYAVIDQRVQRGLDDDRDFRSRRGRP